MSLASKKQVAKIKIMSSKVYDDDDAYRNALQNGYGVNSCTKLKDWQASDFIKKLEQNLPNKSIIPTRLSEEEKQQQQQHPQQEPVSPAGSPFYGKGERGKQKHLTGAQAERISILKDLLNWSDEALTGFIEKQTGKLTGVQMLMNFEAMKLIVGMQRVLTRNLYNRQYEMNVKFQMEYLKDIYKKLNDSPNKKLKETADAI